MIVQIYEIQSPREAEACVSLGVDHIGSVLLSVDEWRNPSIYDVVRLTQGMNSRSSIIPLFQQEEVIYKALDYYRPDFIHFCDSLTDPQARPVDLRGAIALQERVKARFPEVRIMRTIPVPPEGLAPLFPSLQLSRELEHASDIFLIDTWLGIEPVEGYVGITGRTADRAKAKELVLKSSVPIILAGGLSPGNVYQALTKVAPYGADSCTHTNAVDAHGKPLRFNKDLQKVRKFIEEVRRAEKALTAPLKVT